MSQSFQNIQNQKNFKNKYWTYYVAVSLLIFFSFFFGLGKFPLLDNNEGLYASIAQYMLLHKSFIIPHLNCAPYIEKPPLLYWLLSISFSIFGFSSFAARLVTSGSAAILCIALMYFTHHIKRPKIGILATLIFASSICVSIIARTVYFDMLLASLTSLSLLSLFYWYTTLIQFSSSNENQEKTKENKKIKESKFALRFAYAALAFAVLTKGLIAIIIVGGSFGAFLIIEKNLRESIWKMLDWIGIILFLAIAFPWHIAAAIQHQGFLWNYVISEQFLRFLDLRTPHDYYHGSIFYYLPRIIIYLFPWSFLIPLLFWRNKKSNEKQAKIDINSSNTLNVNNPNNSHNLNKKLSCFLWCWLLVPLIFFSLSRAKANYYMIVSMPALALLISLKLNTLWQTNKEKLITIWIAAILVIIAIGFTLFSTMFLPKFPEIINLKHTIFIIILYSFAAAIITLFFSTRPQVGLLSLAGIIVPLMIAANTYLKNNIDSLSASKAGIYITNLAKQNKSNQVNQQNKNHNQFFIYQDLEKISAIAFYANTCFKIIDSQSDDLYYGSHFPIPQYQQFFLATKEFKNLSTSPNQQMYVVVINKKLQQFSKEILPEKWCVARKYDTVAILKKC